MMKGEQLKQTEELSCDGNLEVEGVPSARQNSGLGAGASGIWLAKSWVGWVEEKGVGRHNLYPSREKDIETRRQQLGWCSGVIQSNLHRFEAGEAPSWSTKELVCVGRIMCCLFERTYEPLCN